MTIRDIAEVRPRLEKAVSGLAGDAPEPTDLLNRYEMVSTAMLDSEHDWYPPGHLQELLMSYLYIRQIELGLLECPSPDEI
ncbi:hypothetical protein BST95_19045 [Halioglobus japonicus]|uniref:Uncharacterized protein n=1 Tax=Halioglobus japonicus TaxID=930805 RepID=A0AAP8MBQ9_9GAMM|nr:hypothetical protein [Halioglobus japonicus]AQA20025.1 hypothetical protein BST95_19045 [Halioglobus japonicus]PLW84682.1 hypothetical protein C0029_16885 [Halioglobus japonicus]GHD20890.1 hypothetical protein GCM10007052_31000 [Halioglobus japonicus]